MSSDACIASLDLDEATVGSTIVIPLDLHKRHDVAPLTPRTLQKWALSPLENGRRPARGRRLPRPGSTCLCYWEGDLSTATIMNVRDLLAGRRRRLSHWDPFPDGAP